MKKAYIYILSASPDPNECELGVPYEVDTKEIFFGPCKKRLRQLLWKEYLKDSKDGFEKPYDEIYFIGLNGYNTKKIRKIVWTGKIKLLMSFRYAFENLNDRKYQEMRNDDDSPLHVKPIIANSKHIGYELRSNLHDDNWFKDLISFKNEKIIIKDNKIYVREKYSIKEVLNRDICILFENIFYAHNEGIEIDKQILKIFRKVQIERNHIDNWAIFGRARNGNAIGKTGKWIELNDNLTDSIINIIKERASKINHRKITSNNYYTRCNSFKPKKSCK